VVSTVEPGSDSLPRSIVGRYALYDALASGGMATVHIGRLMGVGGFSRTVAIKRLHPHLANDRDFVAMLLDEARLVVRIRHPNVVPVVDVVQDNDELLLVMEYVQGEPLNVLMRLAADRGERVPLKMARAMMAGILHGLHAAHESMDEKGEPLGIVHRDVSPQNVIIGIDGVARVLDFGIAKATGRLQMTRDGELKGKTPYMSPEQLRGEAVDRRTDIYAAAVLFWEMLTTRRLFTGQTQPEIAYKVLEQEIALPSTIAEDIPPEVDAIVMRGLARDPEDRFATALEMAIAVEELGDLATARTTGAWVEEKGSDRLRERAAIVAAIESSSFQRATLSKLAVAAPALPMINTDLPTMVEGAHRRTESMTPAPAPVEPAPLPSLPSLHLPPSPPAPPREPNRQSALLVLVAVALFTAIAALGVAGWVVWRRAPVVPRLDPISSAPATALPSAVVTASGIASVAPSSVPSSVPSSAPSAVASAPPHASSSGRPTGRGGRPTTARPALPSCDPPYTLDPRGIRIPKPECL